MRRTLPLIILIIAALSLATFAPSTALALKKHKTLSFVTGTPTGTWYPAGAAIADLTNSLYEGQPISVMTGIGSIGNTLHTGNGKSDIGLSYGTFLKLARQGGNELFPKAITEDVRAVLSLTRNTLHLILGANIDPDLSKLKATRPKLRVATGNVGSSELFSTGKLLNAYGITFEDIESWGGRIDRLQTGGRADAWKNRQADLLVFFIQVGSPRVLEAMTLRKSNLVSIKKSVQDEMIQKLGYMKDVIPANSYRGQTTDIDTLGLPFIVFCSAKVDGEIIYDMVKQVAENKPRMVHAGAAFKKWNPEDMVKGLGIEIHPGAMRYYKERGWLK